MIPSETTRYVGTAVGVAAAAFFGISTLASFGLSGRSEYALPALLAVGTVLAGIGVARGRWWSAVVIAAFLVVPIARLVMQDSLSQGWIIALGAGVLVELAVAVLLVRVAAPSAARS